MTTKRIWKNLDEYYGDQAVEEQRRSEFDPQVNAAISDVRDAQGIDAAETPHHQPLSLAAVGAEGGDAPSTAQHSGTDAIAELRKHLPAMSRRGFLQLSGAATVLSMVSCWHNPPETLISPKEHPEGHIYGKANYFSTTIRTHGRAVPIIAKTYDFRPIKLEGNYDATWTRGKLDAAGQAALLDLYDPDRVYSRENRNLEGALRNDGNGRFSTTSWVALDAAVGQALANGGNIGLITPPLDGVANHALIQRLHDLLGNRLRHAAYDPLGGERQRSVRARLYGSEQHADVVYHLDRAQVLITLGTDILGGGDLSVAEQVAFADQRRLSRPGADAQMGNFIAFEAALSQGGTCADLRVRVNQYDIASVGWAIAKRVADALDRSDILPEWAAQEAARGEAAVQAHPTLLDSSTWGAEEKGADRGSGIAYAAEQLIAAHRDGKHSLIYAAGGVNQGPEAEPVLAVATFLNYILGNEGVTIDDRKASATSIPGGTADTLAVLDAAADGELDALIVVDANPVHALGERAANAIRSLAESGLVVACNDRIDETAELANWFAPITHDLESWGDAEPYRGHYCLQQPAVVPLWDVRQWQESLMSFCVSAGMGDEFFAAEIPEEPINRYSAALRSYLWTAENNGVRSWRSVVLDAWSQQVRSLVGSLARPEAFVREAQVTGFVVAQDQEMEQSAPRLDPSAVQALRPAAARNGGYTLLLSPSRALRDGRQANNAWLQEIPDPVSKVTWDTWLAVNIADARDLMIRDNSVIALTLDGTRVEVPVLIQPGMQRGHFELFLGYGRNKAGAVAADGGVDGIQVNGFRLSNHGQRWLTVAEDALEVTRKTYRLANTQGHHYMDGRELALDDVLELHHQDPSLQRFSPHIKWSGTTAEANDPTHSGHNLSLFGSSIVYPGRRWGMAVDMNTCTGCNACVVACSAENNVPVVGRDEVRMGREMHWIRIDRYYTVSSLSRAERLYQRVRESVVVGQEDPDDVEVVHQPMMCQQCGHAPCEEVCPAMATMHNDEGLNVQIYNRCIGTRYCANNCPYKVRRFNWYEYSKYRFGPHSSGDPFGRIARNIVREGSTSSQEELSVLPLNLMLNPTITVRSVGVMEKCNFCLQRTRDIRENEKRTNRKYDDTQPSAITTACAQTCPSEAITFGDINDPNSVVTQRREGAPHRYKVLDARVNTRPSVDYLRKVRNRPATADEAYHVSKLTAKAADAASSDGEAH
ncbi:MAG: 4Fe-4S dicluster domain-containing protein [Planctomycetota bacterium]|nr:MAG: 4Fe-4S dicluster domain-containing protein [Planctomycetota bacterium]